MCQEICEVFTYSLRSSQQPCKEDSLPTEIPIAQMKINRLCKFFRVRPLTSGRGWLWVQADSEAYDILSCTLSWGKHMTHAIWGTCLPNALPKKTINSCVPDRHLCMFPITYLIILQKLNFLINFQKCDMQNHFLNLSFFENLADLEEKH